MIDPSAVELAVQDVVERAAQTGEVSKVWVGFSGGVDSTALLLAATRVAAQHQPAVAVGAIHVNHGIHSEADSWQRQCREVCLSLNADFVSEVVKLPSAGNLEASARAARYACFARHVSANQLLLLGHHQQDQLETVLQRLFSGRGLLPMRSQGMLGEGHFVRPALDLPAQTLRDYVQTHGLSWLNDPSNDDVQFERNFLRHELVPRMLARWKNLHNAVDRVAHQHQNTQQALVHSLAQKPDQLSIDALPPEPSIRLVWLRAFLASRGAFGVSDRALETFVRNLASHENATLSCGDPGELRLQQGWLRWQSASGAFAPVMLQVGGSVTVSGACIQLHACSPVTPLAMASRLSQCPLQVQSRQGGERLVCDAEGRTREVKRLLADAKVPQWQRTDYPLLFYGDELVCVPNVAVAFAWRANPLENSQADSAWCADLSSDDEN